MSGTKKVKKKSDGGEGSTKSGSTSTKNPTFSTNPKDDLPPVVDEEQTPTLKAFDESGWTQQEELGRGAFGNVYGLHKGDEKVALKTGNAAEVKNEADVLGKLGSHENIVGYEGMGQRGNSPTLALEYLGGGNLDEMQEQLLAARNARKISHEQYWGTMQYLLRGVTSGVEHMGEKDLVHGDLKMGNVGLTGPDDSEEDELLTPKVLDFGSTRKVGDQPPEAQTHAVNLTPEQYAPGGTLGKTHDVYAIGQMTHYALEGDYHAAEEGQGFLEFPERKRAYEEGARGEWTSPFTNQNAHDEFLSNTLNPVVPTPGEEGKEGRWTASQALQSDFLSDPLLDDEGASDVLQMMLAQREGVVRGDRESKQQKWARHYGPAKHDLTLARESNRNSRQRRAQARIQNKQEKMPGKRALAEAKEDKSEEDVQAKSEMQRELLKGQVVLTPPKPREGDEPPVEEREPDLRTLKQKRKAYDKDARKRRRKRRR